MDLVTLTHFQCKQAVRSWERLTGVKLICEYSENGFLLCVDNLTADEVREARTYITDFVFQLHQNYENN